MADLGEALLSVPNKSAEEFAKTLNRSSSSYEDRSQRFKVKDRVYTRQYAQLYFTRLVKMTPLLKEAARKKWGSDYPIKRLAELKSGKRCCVIGTLFKKMELKPSILKEISTVRHLVPQPPRLKYIGSNDELILEDQVQRVTLCGDIPSEELVTGIVVALLGKELHNGSFEVEDYCFAGLPRQEESETMETDQEDRYVALVSGLNLGSSWCDQLSAGMMVDYLTGQLGNPTDQQYCSGIVRVIVAGNSISDKPAKTSAMKDSKTRFLSRNYTAESIEAMKELDDILAQLASCVPVDIMPGSHDPTNHQLPQQPLHRCMFPQASQSAYLRGVTNPYTASVEGVVYDVASFPGLPTEQARGSTPPLARFAHSAGRPGNEATYYAFSHKILERCCLSQSVTNWFPLRFLGCSGQNVEDIYRFSTATNRLQILESTLHWRHLAPTAPDTLGCYPYYDSDPFILEECPHIYFSGNQPKFQHKKIQGDNGQTVLVITVPNFDLTHSCVLVNLRTLECQELTFGTSLSRKDNPELKKLLELESQVDHVTSSQPDSDMTLLHHMDMDDDEDD